MKGTVLIVLGLLAIILIHHLMQPASAAPRTRVPVATSEPADALIITIPPPQNHPPHAAPSPVSTPCFGDGAPPESASVSFLFGRFPQ
jgi:hypothetical protein